MLNATSAHLCACGCGHAVRRAPRTDTAKGWVKGEPLRSIRGHSSHPIVGVLIDPHGYRRLYMPDHPLATGGYVLEHVLVASNALGRPLPDGVEVHHVGPDKANNHPSNLVVCQDHAYHGLLELRGRAIAATGDPTSRRCVRCHEWDAPATMRNHGKGTFVHASCRTEYRRERAARS